MAHTSVTNTGGLALELTNDQGVLTRIIDLKKVNDPQLEVDEITNTNQDDAGHDSYAPSMKRTTDLVFEIGYAPGNADDLLISEHHASTAIRPFKLITVKKDGNLREGSASLFIKTYVPDDGTLGNERRATVTARITNAITRQDAI